MAITNYTSLTSAIASWLDVGTADLSGVISDLVMTAEKRLMRELRTPLMETSLSAAISSGAVTVPSDYEEMKFAYVDGTPTTYLQMVPTAYIYDRYPTRGATGKPKVMARDGANFIFGPYPDSAYTIKGTYFKRLTAVETSANPMFTANPDVYLFACLAEAEPLLGRDTRIPLWESKYRMIRDLMNQEGDRSRLGGNLSIRVG